MPESNQPLVPSGVAPQSPGTHSCPFCGEQVRKSALKCRFCGERFRAMIPGTMLEISPSIEPDDLLREYRLLTTLRLKCNLISFAFGIPAVVLTILPWCLMGNQSRVIYALGVVMGMILFAVSFLFIARHKGRNPAWASAAILSVFGLLVVGGIKDYNADRLIVLRAMLMLLGRGTQIY